MYNEICPAKDPERREELHKLYKVYKNHVTNLSRRSKESYFKNLLEKNNKNRYQIWHKIKVLININTQTKYAPICLQIKESILTDKKVIKNKFNNFFNSIATKIDSKIIQTKTNFDDTFVSPNENSFFIHPTTKEETEDFFFNCDSLHARLNSHYKAWSYKKKKHRKVKAYFKSV